MAGVPGGHDAVEKIHSPSDPFNNIRRRPHPHEVTGLVRRHVGLHRVDDIVHHLSGLPHRQTADGVAVAVQLGDLLHVPHPQVGVGPPLVDAEELLLRVDRIRQGIQPVMLCHTALQPPGCPLTGGLHVLVGRGVLHALIKGHGNVAAQVGLNLHRLLRTHKNAPTVNVGSEGDPLLGDLPQAGQGKDLKAPTVGEHGAVPVHKFVKPAHLADNAVPGAKMEVVGVGQLHLTADLLQVVGGHRPLDGPLGAHVHEHRGLDHPVGAGEHPPPGSPLLLQYLKHKKSPL